MENWKPTPGTKKLQKNFYSCWSLTNCIHQEACQKFEWQNPHWGEVSKFLARPPAPLLTERLKKLCLERAKALLNKLKKLPPSTIKIFSDKKLFTVDQVYNCRNDRYIVDKGTPAKPVYKSKHPASVMVLGIVASDGKKCPPIFIPEGLKVNSDTCIDLLRTKLRPWLWRNYPDGNYVFQQDGAPAHTSKKNLKNFWDSLAPQQPRPEPTGLFCLEHCRGQGLSNLS